MTEVAIIKEITAKLECYQLITIMLLEKYVDCYAIDVTSQ